MQLLAACACPTLLTNSFVDALVCVVFVPRTDDAEKNLLFLLAKDDEKEKSADPKQFVFDKVLWKDSEQRDAWEHCGMPMVNATLEGYTACVMCYGQTGAGKSFTLANESKGQEGIMVAAFHHLFEMQAASRDLKYEVAISCACLTK